jgi:AraC-like DNA-binding protein
MPGPEPFADAEQRRPTAALAGLVRTYHGYRYVAFPAGVHRGLPSPDITVVLALGPPTRMTAMPDPADPPAEFRALASGLGTRAVGIAHDGEQYGVQLDLTPLGARRLLGVPAGELASVVVELRELLGPDRDELLDRMAAARTWPARFAVLDEVLLRRAARRQDAARPDDVAAPLRYAWEALVDSGGTVRVTDLASRLGYSRRHLTDRFTAEYGLRPKQFARVVRFSRSKQLLRSGRGTLADVAADCGYYDQAHLAREWVALAGCPPTTWLREEHFPIVQAEAGAGASSSGP